MYPIRMFLSIIALGLLLATFPLGYLGCAVGGLPTGGLIIFGLLVTSALFGWMSRRVNF